MYPKYGLKETCTPEQAGWWHSLLHAERARYLEPHVSIDELEI